MDRHILKYNLILTRPFSKENFSESQHNVYDKQKKNVQGVYFRILITTFDSCQLGLGENMEEKSSYQANM